eukprot:CAMPEP_0202690138 /NCGR_PEP_ID=MMETSP1385-20130828/5232_1 /ASSEMBLY_ACC=CAM_ASM_000861 /TAXON_ID=933848 /ORGANISM="Elphidium margaritaceum" /LENGTH=216 /DNA_ID=CAMNT_0049345371 /DNA_START=13 /DNA_END=663 /DNA_ORIENTATION=-
MNAYDEDDDEIIHAKVVLLGSAGVGKTCLVIKYKTGNFPTMATPTIGASYMAKTVQVNKTHKLKLQMWDTAGQERFASMASLYYRGADAAILVFDCTVPESLLSVRNWVKELQDHVDVSEDIVLILAANKCDLQAANSEESKQLMAEATDYAKDIGARLWRTSAKASININEMFNDVAESIYTIKTTNGSMLSDDDDHGNRIIFEDPKQKNKKCCG